MTVDASGGTVVVDDPNSPIDGLSITVPAEAYSERTTFDISSRPYEGDVPAGSAALTPLIEVRNGGAFADDLMEVTIPIDLPEGNFAMGFFVHEDGTLEGMPLVELTDRSITVATRHFSDLLILTIPESELPTAISTGFYPGRDDWEFPNTGSYLGPNGNCSGQVLTMAWYFYERRLAPGPKLFGRYDNNGGTPTPETWKDNSNGYRLASVIQKDLDWQNEMRKAFGRLHRDGNDTMTWKALLYSMFITQEPQFISVHRTGGAHALLVYGADRTKGELFIADPNYPGDTTRRIRLVNGTFTPYKFDTGTTSYPTIFYCAKSALVPWEKLTARWAEFENGTIGDGMFPSYELEFSSSEDESTVLGDTFETTAERGKIVVTSSTAKPVYFEALVKGTWFAVGDHLTFPLKMGVNRFGFYMTGKHTLSGGNLVGGEYVDFRWVEIVRVAEVEEEVVEEEPVEVELSGTVVTGVYYGQLQTNTSRDGELLFVVDADDRFVQQNAPEILSVEADANGRVVSTRFRFRRGLGNPAIPAGRWRICAGPRVGTYYAKSQPFTTTGEDQQVHVVVGQPPRVGE